MTWDKVKDLADGEPVLLDHAIWSEMYKALYERSAVLTALGFGPGGAGAAIPDPSLLVDVNHATRQTNLAELLAYGTVSPSRPFAKERDEAACLDPDTYSLCFWPRYDINTAGGDLPGWCFGAPRTAMVLSVLEEAGQGKDDQYGLPGLLKAEFFTDFYHACNLMTITEVGIFGYDWSDWSHPDFQGADGFAAGNAAWDAERAKAFGDINEPGPPHGWAAARIVDHDVGRNGDSRVAAATYFARSVYKPHQGYSLDLSVLNGIKDADNDDIGVARLIVLVWYHRCPYESTGGGRPTDYVGMPYEVAASGDGGTSWTVLKTGTTDASDDGNKFIIATTDDADLINADSCIRVAYNGVVTDAPAGFSPPLSDEYKANRYCESITIEGVFCFVEWGFKHVAP